MSNEGLYSAPYKEGDAHFIEEMRKKQKEEEKMDEKGKDCLCPHCGKRMKHSGTFTCPECGYSFIIDRSGQIFSMHRSSYNTPVSYLVR